MSNLATTADFPTGSDLTISILSVRIDSTTKSVQISTTGTTIDVQLNCVTPTTHSFSATSSTATSVSTTPVSLYSNVVDYVGKFAEIYLFNTTYLTTYMIMVHLF